MTSSCLMPSTTLAPPRPAVVEKYYSLARDTGTWPTFRQFNEAPGVTGSGIWRLYHELAADGYLPTMTKAGPELDEMPWRLKETRTPEVLPEPPEEPEAHQAESDEPLRAFDEKKAMPVAEKIFRVFQVACDRAYGRVPPMNLRDIKCCMAWTVAGVTALKARGPVEEAIQARLKENKSLPSSITLVREALQTVADIPYEEAVKIVEQSDALKPLGYQGRPLVAVNKGPTTSGVTRTIVARTSFDVF